MKFKNHEIKLAIFDMDGTLIDSTGIWEKIDKGFFAKRGFKEVPKDYAKDIVHMGLDKGAEMTISRYNLLNDTKEGILKEWKDASTEQYVHKIPLKEGVKEFLDYLKSNNVILTIATANDKSLYTPCLNRLGIFEYFDTIIDVDSIKQGKDSPAIFLKLSEKYSVRPENTLVLEDSLIGIKTAHRAGFVTVGVFDEQSKNNDQEKRKNSDYYIESFKDFCNFLF